MNILPVWFEEGQGIRNYGQIRDPYKIKIASKMVSCFEPEQGELLC